MYTNMLPFRISYVKNLVCKKKVLICKQNSHAFSFTAAAMDKSSLL